MNLNYKNIIGESFYCLHVVHLINALHEIYEQ